MQEQINTETCIHVRKSLVQCRHSDAKIDRIYKQGRGIRAKAVVQCAQTLEN